MMAIRDLALTHPVDDDRPLPSEKELASRFAVSRGTLRRATEDLARLGLLRSEPGRGTYVVRKTQIRMLMEDELRGIAHPDSRWHLDVSRFVPDFDGSERCHESLRAQADYVRAHTLFVTPDNSLQGVIRHALDDGKTALVPTYGMRRGIVRLDGVAQCDRAFASTLDGLERFGQTLGLAALGAVGTIDLVITGATALTKSGIHIGGEDGYFELEWALLSELGLVSNSTPIVAVVHDIQLIDVDLSPGPEDIGVDTIITPSHVIPTGRVFTRPTGVHRLLSRVDLASMPYFEGLRRHSILSRDHPQER